MGVGQAPLQGARGRHAGRRVHRRRDRRHVRRRVRQRDAAVASTSGSWPPTTTGTSSSTRDPTPATGFAERKRLFELPRSSWDDYDRELISEGGGVFPRTAKSIRLSPQAREALGRRARSRCAPTDVIRAILRAPVDLLWNGGIGTVVKASTETDADAADRSSRRDPRQRERAAREGRGRGRQPRLHAPRAGRVRGRRRAHQRRLHRQLGRRRLLRPRGQPEDPARAGRAARRADPRRARRAAASTSPRTSPRTSSTTRFLQAQIIAQEVDRSASRLYAYEDLMALLEEHKILDRASEDLPTSEEIGERRRAGRGMERPELAILVAYAKRLLARALEAIGLRRGAVAGARPARVLPGRGRQALRAPARRAPAAPPADLHGQLQPGRQLARADVRLAAGGRARRRARRRRARLPDRPRGDRRRRALGGRRAARGRRQGAAAGADGRRRLARRGDHALVPDLGAGRRHRGDDRRRPRRLRAARGGARRPRLRRAPARAASRPPSGWSASACPSRSRAPTRCAPSSATRPTWCGSRARPAARSRRSPRSSSRSAPSCAWTGSRPSSSASRRRRGCSAGRCRPCARTPPRCAASSPAACSPRPTGGSPQEAVEAYLAERGDARRRFTAFLRSLSREGEPDLAGLTLAVRQLRALT